MMLTWLAAMSSTNDVRLTVQKLHHVCLYSSPAGWGRTSCTAAAAVAAAEPHLPHLCWGGRGKAVLQHFAEYMGFDCAE